MPRPHRQSLVASLVTIVLVLCRLATGSANAQGAPADPRAIVRQATRAVQAGAPAPLRDSWQARLRADSSDRAATLGLATISRLTYDYPTAERLYRRLIADSTRPDRYVAMARIGLARELEGRGFSVQAGPHFTRARDEARAAGDSLAEAEVLLPLAFVRGRTAGLPAAEALLDTAARLMADSAFDLRSQLHSRRAIIRGVGGSPEAALEADSAIALARRAGDPRLEGDGYRALGMMLVYGQKFDSALTVIGRAEELYRRAHDRSALASHLVWRAQALGNLGRFGEMREAMRLALVEGEASHNPAAVATAYRSLGALALMLGDFATASEDLRKSTAISSETGDSLGVATTRKFVADVALAAGNAAEARRLAIEQLETGRRMGEVRDEFEAHQMLAELAMRAHDWAAADRSLGDARAVLERLKGSDYRLWLLHLEGRLARARGDLAGAERAFGAFLRTDTSATGSADSRFDVRLRLADVHAARGHLAGAEREMVAAADDLDRWRSRLSDAELRVRVFQTNPSQHARAADPAERDALVARVIGALAAGGRGEAAFALAERRRARELQDRLVRADVLRADRTTAGRARSAAPAAAHDSASSVAAVPMTSAAVAARLPDERTALLEFVGGVDGAPTTIFVVRRGGLRARVLPPADSLADRVARFVALLEAGTAADEGARSLGAALLEPALPDVGATVTRLVVVPDGPLHAVPWDALRLADGRYVAERYAVSVAPSATVLVELRRRGGERAAGATPVRLLAYGDPAFAGEHAAASGAAESYRSAFDSTGGLPRLRASADEARLVARYADDAEVRLREGASAAYLKHTPLDRFAVIHLATHALVDERSMTRTALAMAPGARDESGFVGPGDLAALTLDADLVVLSACRSAGGVVVGGEGVQGLTAPLLEAGARTVVATRWRIGDRSTVRFVDDFYAALARGLPVGDALREARLSAIRRGAPPREWAAFVAVGDPLVTVPLHAPTPGGPRLWTLVAAAALVGAALLAYRVRNRRRGRTEEAR